MAAAFSTGLFFHHKSSPHTKIFRMMARDLITQAADGNECKSFNFYYHSLSLHLYYNIQPV